MKKGTVQKYVAWLLVMAMVVTLLPVGSVQTLAETTDSTAQSASDSTGTSSVKLDVDQSRKLEVALAVGNTKQNYSAFETDLKAALKDLGINEGNISFVEVDASASTSQESFPWWTYDHTTSTGTRTVNETSTAHTYIERNGSSYSRSTALWRRRLTAAATKYMYRKTRM